MCRKKYTIEYVKNYFIKEGYTPLFNDYINSGVPVKVRCPKGHCYMVNFSNFKTLGRRCPICSNRKKYTDDYVKSYFIDRGYMPLFDHYIASRNPIKTMCPMGHICYISFDNFKNKNRRCLTCYRESIRGSGHPMYGKHHSDETKKRLSEFRGEKSSNWKGGISCEPYCPLWKDKGYKESIKKRDNYTCQNPYCYGNDTRLHIHHIDYNKKNCALKNLITLCGSCNTKANTDREWHKTWYQTLMNHKYGYKY